MKLIRIVFPMALLIATACSTTHAGARDLASSNPDEKTIDVSCSAPTGFAGTSASVTGKLKLSPIPSGAYLATGKLHVKIGGSTARPILDSNLNVQGQYDRANGVEYATLGTKSDDVSVIYLNFSTRDRSYVEKDGKSYLMNCVN